MSGLGELFEASSSSNYFWHLLSHHQNHVHPFTNSHFSRRLLSSPPSDQGGDHHLSITAITGNFSLLLGAPGIGPPPSIYRHNPNSITSSTPSPPHLSPPFWSSSSGGHLNKVVGNVSAYVTHPSSNSTSSQHLFSSFNDTYPLGASPVTIILEPDLRLHHPILAIFLTLICFIVVFGNVLTIVAIWRERYLHTVTNYFVASLAVADCIVGSVVMPFSIVHEVMNKWWIFGQDW